MSTWGSELQSPGGYVGCFTRAVYHANFSCVCLTGDMKHSLVNFVLYSITIALNVLEFLRF